MNVILIGANGAGKTSLSKILYKQNYHLFKVSPLAPTNMASIVLSINDFNVVLDRWSPIDRAVYANDEELFERAITLKDQINANSIILYLENFTDYDSSFDSNRVVQRPDYTDLLRIVNRYRSYVKRMSMAGVHIYHINVRSNINETLDLVQKIIKEAEEAAKNKRRTL